jgi:hypothetical protein
MLEVSNLLQSVALCTVTLMDGAAMNTDMEFVDHFSDPSIMPCTKHPSAFLYTLRLANLHLHPSMAPVEHLSRALLASPKWVCQPRGHDSPDPRPISDDRSTIASHVSALQDSIPSTRRDKMAVAHDDMSN